MSNVETGDCLYSSGLFASRENFCYPGLDVLPRSIPFDVGQLQWRALFVFEIHLPVFHLACLGISFL